MIKQKKELQKLALDLLYITFGGLISGIAINAFLVPNKIVTGGLTGLTTVIYYLIGQRISVGVLMLSANLALLAVGYKLINKKAMLRSVYGMLMFSLTVDGTKGVVDSYLNVHLYGTTNTDILLYSLFGGALLGIGIGIIISRGGSTGGTDFLARIIIHLCPKFDLSKLLLIIDVIIISIATLVFKNVLYALYGIITVVMLTRLINAVIERSCNARAAFIISEHPEKVSNCILNELDCGLTRLYGKRGYRGEDTEVLLCVYYKNIIKELHEKVTLIDPKAFIIQTDVNQVHGRGFTIRR
jgi:uncharacterized membrane-anchored protein YitT (DUF2179 family)